MRILMINHFPLEGSGSGTYTKNLAKHLKELGHEVCVIFPENENNYGKLEDIIQYPIFFKAEEEIEGALPFNFPCFTTHPRSTTTFESLNEDELQQYLLAFKETIQKVITEFKPDVIHGQHIWMLSSLVNEYNIPLVLTAHGTDLIGYNKWPKFREYADQAMEKCDYVISISKDNFTLLEETFPAYKEKFILMRNGYDPTVFYPEKVNKEEILQHYNIPKDAYANKRIITFAGKLTHFKGVDVLLKALKELDSELSIITVIAGDGEEMNHLQQLKKELELKTVYFIGNVNQEALRKIYAIGDLNIVPSRREAFGLVAIEAMACGTPVVASGEGGLLDFVNEEVGALFTSESPTSLAKAITKTLPRVKESWREKIAQYVRTNYAQDKIMEELIAVYQRAMNKA